MEGEGRGSGREMVSGSTNLLFSSLYLSNIESVDNIPVPLSTLR